MEPFTIEAEALRKLLGAASPDAALLYLYCKAGLPQQSAAEALRLPQHRIDCAAAALRQMGLWTEQEKIVRPDQPPRYTEADVAHEMEQGPTFRLLVGEAQRRLGRVLSTEELKMLLCLRNYLGLPDEVIGILITYCIERARARGNVRPPSMRAIEKEAYHWADAGIDTLEEAAAYMQAQLERQTRSRSVARILQLGERKLTPGEEKYVLSWLEMGFGEGAIALAYERTCLNTGGLKWAYLNSILRSWHEQGLHSVQQIEAGDAGPARSARPARPQQAVQHHGDALTALEREAIQKMMQQELYKED